MKRYVCIHGHFYQPPRENPWLESIELQDSAYPYHDWNERINTECYATNAVSRILDEQGRIVRIVNNYASISFNFGPTLLNWLEANATETYERILDADRQSVQRFSGHGSALAQAYNHMILPLANRRDKVTQVKWAIADFEKRFGRKPEGMWLPETAVDLETLDVLAEQGIVFTILAPRQAERWRSLRAKNWKPVEHDHIDATRPYIQRLPSGRSINLFFYDGPVSQALAFERLLTSGKHFADRLIGAFPDHAPESGRSSVVKLVNIATDGESYGHHHRHGDMALAFALHELEQRSDVTITNYGEFLARHSPQHEVQIKEGTSWSCAHGIERWRSDCGCNTGGRPDWNQQWREPLRNALDWLRDALAPQYEQSAAELLADPWHARDGYVDVINDRSDESIASYFAKHAVRELTPDEQTRALKLLELQRNLLLMYTSCGWFFDELSGIETVQVIQYAGRAVQLAEELFDFSAETEFVNRLEAAKCNIPEHRDGRKVYETMVKPAIVDLFKVGGHYAITSLFDEEESRDRVFCYGIERLDYQRFPSGRSQLAVGRARISSVITRESEEISFGVLHLGDHNIVGGVREFRGNEAYEHLKEQAAEAFSRGDVPETIHRLEEHFGEQLYTVTSLFRDDQRRILSRILDATIREVEQSYRRVYEDHVTLMRSLASMGAHLPRILCTTAEFALNMELRRAFESGSVDPERVQAILSDAALWHLSLDAAGLSYALQRSMERLAEQVAADPDDLARLAKLNQLAELAQSLPFEVDLWKTQNVFYELRERERKEHPEHVPAEAVSPDGEGDKSQHEDWEAQFRSLGEKLRVGAV